MGPQILIKFIASDLKCKLLQLHFVNLYRTEAHHGADPDQERIATDFYDHDSNKKFCVEHFWKDSNCPILRAVGFPSATEGEGAGMSR